MRRLKFGCMTIFDSNVGDEAIERFHELMNYGEENLTPQESEALEELGNYLDWREDQEEA